MDLIKFKYPGHGIAFIPEKLRRLLDKEDWEQDDGDPDQEVRSIFLGTIFGLTPSGKYYMPFACSNVMGCDSCKGTGMVLMVKRRVHKKRTAKQAHSRRHYMKPGHLRTYARRDDRDAKHAQWMRIYHNYANSYRSCTACGGMGSREAYLDEKWREYAEAVCESIGACLTSGEGDPCDLFVTEYREKDWADERLAHDERTEDRLRRAKL